MIYIIDLFCGAGGLTTGAMQVNGVKVIACVNHDPLAIKSHEENHPDCLHFIEDIRTLPLEKVQLMIKEIRATDPDAVIVLHASLECTNFSKAKGGLPRNADSRTLAEHLIESEDTHGVMQPRYIPLFNADLITIENVEEFLSWGPLDEKGKPVSRKNGQDYMRWVENVKAFGYEYDYRILNSADYGAVTKRKRLFIQFAKPHMAISWPEPTHAKTVNKNASLFDRSLQPWKAVRDILELDKHGRSIFGRDKNLSDKTYARIYAGLVKFVAGGKEAFLVKYNSMGRTGGYQAPSINEPCPTVAVQGRLAIATPQFISKQFSGHPESKNQDLEQPAPTVKPRDNNMLVTSDFLVNYQHSSQANDLEEPCPTITCKDKYAYLTTYHGNGNGLHHVDGPAPTIPTKDSAALVQPEPFIMRDFTGGGQLNDIASVAGALTNVPKMNLVTPEPWVMSTNFTNIGSTINKPAQTVTANRKHHYLMNPQYMGNGGSIDQPAFTLIARMDKAPPYLVQVEDGQFAIAIEYGDSEHMVKIKEFMAIYGIIDIKMRMLFIDELKQIQGFPKGYYLAGTQADQKKFIGNAVEVNQARALFEAIAKANLPSYRMAVA